MPNNGASQLVVWLDEEPALVASEVYDLETLGYSVRPFQYANEALDWFLNSPEEAIQAVAIIIDVLMPSLEDPRLKSADGTPVSVKICQNLECLNIWSEIKTRIVFYSRLPGGRVLDIAKSYADEQGIPLERKSSKNRIARELIKAGRIPE